jgi:hypothetical protein
MVYFRLIPDLQASAVPQQPAAKELAMAWFFCNIRYM